MDKTKKYQIGSLKFDRAEYAWTSEGWNASCINDEAMERFISDGIATEVKEKFKGSMVVTMGNVGYVDAYTGGTDDLSLEFGNILRTTFGGADAVASKKFQVDITEL